MSRILVVDDDPSILKLVQRILTVAGFAVEAVSSAIDALDRIASSGETVDLLLTDLAMPDMNGLELAHAFKRSCPDTPVLLMTGHAADCADELRGWSVMPKPFSPTEVVRRIREIVGAAAPT